MPSFNILNVPTIHDGILGDMSQPLDLQGASDQHTIVADEEELDGMETHPRGAAEQGELRCISVIFYNDLHLSSAESVIHIA